ncbi:DUF2939 domain-containing protein [Acinetobacter tianfuensis]|nr:DUF2939 domain-containing protein [Acinetobacter tianfuensis]
MKILKWSTAAVLFLAVLCFWASPYWVLKQIHQAFEQNQPEKISAYIDYESLKTSLKPQIMQRLQDGARLHALPAGLKKWAVPLSEGLSNHAADALARPQSLSLLMQGKALKEVLADQYTAQASALERLVLGNERLQQNTVNAAEGEQSIALDHVKTVKPKARARYIRWDRFAVDVPADSGEVHTVLLQRSGWSWKIVALEFAN